MPRKQDDPDLSAPAPVVAAQKPGAPDAAGPNMSPLIRPQNQADPLNSADPMAPLRAKYPGQPGQQGRVAPVFQTSKPDPNDQWSWLPPSGKDITFGGVGAGLSGIDSLHKDATDPAKATKIQSKLDEFNSTATRMRGLADGTSDPALKAGYLKSASAAERGARYQKTGLNALTGPAKVARNISDPNWTGQQIGKAGQKVTDMGVNTAQKATEIGDKIESLSPGAARVGQKVANGGINTALGAGQLGEGLGSFGPGAGRLGQKVTAAGISVGGKVVDLGGNLGPNVGKFGQGVAAAGVGAGGRAAAAGQELGQTAKLLAPRLAQVGKHAAVVGEWVGKRAPGLGLAVTGVQAATDLMDGKPKGRVAAETTGSLVGGAVGTWLGGIAGSAIPIPVVGTAVGAAVGNFVGSYVGGKLGDLVADQVEGRSAGN